MRTYCPSDIALCRPLHRGTGRSETGPRIGGRAPLGVHPSAECWSAKYLATLPLTDDRQIEISIFYSQDRFNRMVDVPNNEIITSLGSIIDAIIHDTSVRGQLSDLTSPISEHPLVICEPTDDKASDDEGNVITLPDHKIGGRPFLVRGVEELANAVKLLQDQGFLQLVQFDFIVSADAQWSGDWPFADGLFHLFGKPPFERGDLCWLWQF